MSNYTKSTNFTAKDGLTSGDPNKLIKGSEVDPEFDNIATSISTKADKTVPANANNVATLGGGGSLQDGGYRFSALTGEITATTFELNNTASIPSGTKMLFQQTAAPTGWTKDTTHDDKALRIVNGTVGSGGTLAFSGISGLSTDGYTLLEADIPSHTHLLVDSGFVSGGVNSALTASNHIIKAASGSYSGDPDYEYSLGGTAGAADIGLSSATGGDGAHSHVLSTLDPSYVDVIIATRD